MVPVLDSSLGGYRADGSEALGIVLWKNDGDCRSTFLRLTM